MYGHIFNIILKKMLNLKYFIKGLFRLFIPKYFTIHSHLVCNYQILCYSPLEEEISSLKSIFMPYIIATIDIGKNKEV